MDIHELKASLIDLKSRLDEIKENVFKITTKERKKVERKKVKRKKKVERKKNQK